MLRSHYEQCDSCARELAQFERTAGALGGLATIEPSPEFARRVQDAFVRAHPELARRRFTLLPRVAVAAAVLLSVAGGLIIATSTPSSDGHMGIVTPERIPDGDPEHIFLPQPAVPKAIDAAAWGEAAAVDRLLVASIQAPRSWDDELRKALTWLASKQEADGSWKGHDSGESVELTGLAVLILNGANDAAVAKAAEFLISRQRDSGAIGGGSPESHAIATLALLEASIRSGHVAWAKAAAKGVEVIAQQNHDGPWGRGPVAAWQYHVLRLASASGDRSLVPVLVHGHDAPGSGLWADPAPDRAGWAGRVAGLLNRSPIPGLEPATYAKNDLRLAYFGTTLLRPLEGDAWTKWWSPLRAKLLKAQQTDGSWPEGFEPGKGKLYATAFAALILQTPQRLPSLPQ